MMDNESEVNRIHQDSDAENSDEDFYFRPKNGSRYENGKQDYYTFPNFSGNSEEIRNRSVSLPYISHGARTFKRSFTTLDYSGTTKEASGFRANSTGNINHSLNESADFASTDENEPEGKSYCGFTKRQFKSGVALCLVSVVDVMGFSIFSPFFPVVAKEKNLTEIEIGLIFAAFSMAGIFAALLTGTLLVRVGAKFVVLSGLFWSAGATICFGVLDKVSEEYFFWLCFACRILMGIGSASAFTALFAVIFQEFSDRSLTAIGISESLCSIGGIVGPLIGGGLYDAGGYVLPFAFLGGTQFAVLVASAFLLPPVSVERKANAVSPAWLLLNLHGLFSALFVIICFTVNAFITANLSLFLNHAFGLSAFMVGVYMLVFSIFYGISTPIWGYFADSRGIGAHLMAVSCLLGGIVLSLFGPADFWLSWFGWTGPHKWLVLVCTGTVGALMGGLIMPTFGEMIVAAKQMKLQDNELAEYGLVSGLWNTVFSIGDILGPTLGGAMVPKYKFNNTLAIFAAVMIGLAILKFIHLIYLGCKPSGIPVSDEEANVENDERQSLLRPSETSIQT